MSDVLLFAAGLVAGWCACWFGSTRPTRAAFRAVIDRERERHDDVAATLLKDLHVAEDRLYAAWQDKAIIPPRPVDVRPAVPLEPELLDEINQWEKAETRAAVESRLRELRGQGLSPAAAVHQYHLEQDDSRH